MQQDDLERPRAASAGSEHCAARLCAVLGAARPRQHCQSAVVPSPADLLTDARPGLSDMLTSDVTMRSALLCDVPRSCCGSVCLAVRPWERGRCLVDRALLRFYGSPHSTIGTGCCAASRKWRRAVHRLALAECTGLSAYRLAEGGLGSAGRRSETQLTRSSRLAVSAQNAVSELTMMRKDWQHLAFARQLGVASDPMERRRLSGVSCR